MNKKIYISPIVEQQALLNSIHLLSISISDTPANPEWGVD